MTQLVFIRKHINVLIKVLLFKRTYTPIHFLQFEQQSNNIFGITSTWEIKIAIFKVENHSSRPDRNDSLLLQRQIEDLQLKESNPNVNSQDSFQGCNFKLIIFITIISHNSQTYSTKFGVFNSLIRTQYLWTFKRILKNVGRKIISYHS